MSSRSFLILDLLFKKWEVATTRVRYSLSAFVVRVVILHILEKVARVCVAEKQGWHWEARPTDPKSSSLYVPQAERSPRKAACTASELVPRGGFFSSGTWCNLATLLVCWERDYCLRMSSDPWSLGLYSACHVYFFQNHDYHSSKDSSLCRNTF